MKNNAPQTNPYGCPREAQTPRNKEDFKREYLRTEDPNENPDYNEGFGGGFVRSADAGVGKKKTPRNTILTFFRRLVFSVAKWLRDMNEFWGIPVALLAFLGFPFLLRLADSTAGSYDLSVLQSLLLGVLAFWFVKGVAWWLLRLDFPEVYRWLDDQLETLFAEKKAQKNAQMNAECSNHDSKEEERHAWQKARLRTVVSLSLYALYLLLLVVMVIGLL